MPVYKDEKTKTYYANFYYTDFTGKRIHKKKRGFPKKGDAQQWEREFLLSAAGDCDMLFSSLTEMYFKDMEHRLRDGTIGTKRSVVDTHVLPYFQNKKVSEISPVDIRRWQNIMATRRSEDGSPYSQTYLRTMHTQLNAILNYAVRFYNLKVNPCAAAGSMGKNKSGRMTIWTLDQFNQAIKEVKMDGKRLAIELLFWSGCREGEMLALTPDDVLETNEIRIVKTHHRKNGEDAPGPTKTERGTRLVSLPKWLAEDLRAYCKELYGLKPTDRIFYFGKGTLGRELHRVAKLTGLPDIRVHDLRHSSVSLLIEMKYSVNLIAERIGDTPEIVMSTYAHLYPNKQAEVAHQMELLRDGLNSQK